MIVWVVTVPDGTSVFSNLEKAAIYLHEWMGNHDFSQVTLAQNCSVEEDEDGDYMIFRYCDDSGRYVEDVEKCSIIAYRVDEEYDL